MAPRKNTSSSTNSSSSSSNNQHTFSNPRGQRLNPFVQSEYTGMINHAWAVPHNTNNTNLTSTQATPANSTPTTNRNAHTEQDYLSAFGARVNVIVLPGAQILGQRDRRQRRTMVESSMPEMEVIREIAEREIANVRMAVVPRDWGTAEETRVAVVASEDRPSAGRRHTNAIRTPISRTEGNSCTGGSHTDTTVMSRTHVATGLSNDGPATKSSRRLLPTCPKHQAARPTTSILRLPTHTSKHIGMPNTTTSHGSSRASLVTVVTPPKQIASEPVQTPGAPLRRIIGRGARGWREAIEDGAEFSASSSRRPAVSVMEAAEALHMLRQRERMSRGSAEVQSGDPNDSDATISDVATVVESDDEDAR